MKWIYMHKQILSQLSRQTDIACDRAFRKYKIQYLLGWHYLIIEHFFVFTEIFLFLNVSLQFYWNRVATHQGERLVIKLHHIRWIYQQFSGLCGFDLLTDTFQCLMRYEGISLILIGFLEMKETKMKCKIF